MLESQDNGRPGTAPKRLVAGAPISWGVCELPGWGPMLPPERVLGEMVALGLEATELGPIGYLPLEAAPLRALLDSHGLGLAAGFVPLALGGASPASAREEAARMAALLAGAGAEVFVAAVVGGDGWDPGAELDEQGWRQVLDGLAEVEEIAARHGLVLALHPHAGTLVESEAHVARVAAESAVRWCLDTGHLLIAGVDLPEFVRSQGGRIAHVHLKDVDAGMAARVRSRETSFTEAVQAGLFRPLGQGDAGIEEVVRLLDRSGYERWLVLEQDTAITGQEPPVGSGPVADVRASVDYLNRLAPATEEVSGR